MTIPAGNTPSPDLRSWTVDLLLIPSSAHPIQVDLLSGEAVRTLRIEAERRGIEGVEPAEPVPVDDRALRLIVILTASPEIPTSAVEDAVQATANLLAGSGVKVGSGGVTLLGLKA